MCARLGDRYMAAAELDWPAATPRWQHTFTQYVQGSKTRQHALLAVTDGFVIAVAIVVALALGHGWGERGNVPIWLVLSLPPIWLASLAIFGAYSLPHLRTGMEEYQRIATASMGLAGAIGIICYLLEAEVSRTFLVVAFLLGVPFLLALRFTRRRAFRRLRARGIMVAPIVVVGSSAHVDSISRVLHRESWLGYRVVGALTTEDVPATAGGIPALGRIGDVAELIARMPLRALIFAEGAFPDAQAFKRMAWELERSSTQMIVVPAITDTCAARMSTRPVGGLPLMHVERPKAVAASRWSKRAFDIVGSLILLALAAPFMAVAAIAIRFEDRGPVIFRQTRVGRWGETFECLKIRSMVIDAEARKAALAASNEGAGPLFKMARDPRITRVGSFIRRFSIDELPQFLNVLRGEMSLVGPRPALPTEVAAYDKDTTRRLHVRPGLTGLWQVSGRSSLSWDETVRLDVYYVDNWSMFQDLVIIARTAKAVLGSRGAY